MPSSAHRGIACAMNRSARTMCVTSWGSVAVSTSGLSARRFMRREMTRTPSFAIVEKPGELTGWPVASANDLAVG